MSNEIQKFQGVNFLDPESFENAQRVANMFIWTDLVPDQYKAVPRKGETDKQAMSRAMSNIILALNISGRMGADLLQICQNLNIIKSRISWSAKFLIATVNTCGRFEPIKYKFGTKGPVGEVKFVESVWSDAKKKMEDKVTTFDGKNIENLTCIAYTSERGSKDILESMEVSVLMAIQEGWWQKKNSKWPTMTKQMLMYRTASFWTNSYAPEISLGFEMSEEESPAKDHVEYEEIESTSTPPNSQPIDIVEEKAEDAVENAPAVDSDAQVEDEVKKGDSKATGKTVVKKEEKGEDPKPGENNNTGDSLFNDDPYANQ